MSDPYIVANSDVPLGHRGLRSEVSEIVTKRRIRSQPIGGHVIRAVLTAKKYAATISDRAELADPQHASGRSGRNVQVPPREPTDLVFTKIRSKIESSTRGQSPRRETPEPPANAPQPGPDLGPQGIHSSLACTHRCTSVPAHSGCTQSFTVTPHALVSSRSRHRMKLDTSSSLAELRAAVPGIDFSRPRCLPWLPVRRHVIALCRRGRFRPPGRVRPAAAADANTQ